MTQKQLNNKKLFAGITLLLALAILPFASANVHRKAASRNSGVLGVR